MSTDGPLQLAVFWGDTVSVYEVGRGAQLTIGRDEDCDIRVDAFGVSRKHAVVHGGPPVELEDLGSSNGTFVALTGTHAKSGRTDPIALKRVAGKRVALSVGDSINIGNASAVLRRGRSDDVETPMQDVILVEPTMKELYDEAGRASKAQLPVLVLGETGVGKDVLAQWIHRASPRRDKPFLALNCAALTESLLESELFGHERGAFTGAQQTRVGLLESADGGTVFLDEIGDLPLTIQAKLLRVIERREVLRLGARAPRSIDVRFISATNKDLEAAVEAGTFRSDLYFRLNGLTLTIPALRERRSEIAPLAKQFAKRSAQQLELPGPPPLTAATIAILESHSWPGNIRELRNVIERAVVLAGGQPVAPLHLPKKMTAKPVAPATGGDVERLRREMADAERKRILDGLAQCDGNQTRAAELLGISRRTLINRLEEYGVERPRKK
jgi:two-component system, NtrC family, response regulator AtoC